MKIAFLGNSLVEGSYGGNFVAEVATRLPQHEIINAGQNGNTVINLLARLDGVLEQEPDGVFVFCGGNDAISYAQPDTRRYYERAMQVPGGVVTPDAFRTAFRELMTGIQLAHATTWVALSPNEYNPATQDAVRLYNQIMREEAGRMNIPILDLMMELAPESVPDRPPLGLKTISLIGQRVSAGWQDYESERQLGGYSYSFDGLHFTPETAIRVADRVIEFLT